MVFENLPEVSSLLKDAQIAKGNKVLVKYGENYYCLVFDCQGKKISVRVPAALFKVFRGEKSTIFKMNSRFNTEPIINKVMKSGSESPALF